jgi:hypothetical protein
LSAPEQDTLVKQIGLALLRAAPRDWKRIAVNYRTVGRYHELDGEITLADGSTTEWVATHDIATLFARLRSGMYREQRGTWFNARYTLDAPASYNLEYDREEPEWNLLPPPQAYADELRMFPRSDENVPEWLMRRLAGLGPERPGPRLRIARVFDGTDETGRPVIDRDELDPDEQVRVLEYLEDAPVVRPGRGFDIDRLAEDPEPAVPVGFHSDGEWIWPAAVPYYLREYGVTPDYGLLDHIRNNDYRVPAVSEEQRAAAADYLTRGNAAPEQPAALGGPPMPRRAEATAQYPGPAAGGPGGSAGGPGGVDAPNMPRFAEAGSPGGYGRPGFGQPGGGPGGAGGPGRPGGAAAHASGPGGIGQPGEPSGRGREPGGPGAGMNGVGVPGVPGEPSGAGGPAGRTGPAAGRPGEPGGFSQGPGQDAEDGGHHEPYDEPHDRFDKARDRFDEPQDRFDEARDEGADFDDEAGRGRHEEPPTRESFEPTGFGAQRGGSPDDGDAHAERGHAGYDDEPGAFDDTMPPGEFGEPEQSDRPRAADEFGGRGPSDHEAAAEFGGREPSDRQAADEFGGREPSDRQAAAEFGGPEPLGRPQRGGEYDAPEKPRGAVGREGEQGAPGQQDRPGGISGAGAAAAGAAAAGMGAAAFAAGSRFGGDREEEKRGAHRATERNEESDQEATRVWAPPADFAEESQPEQPASQRGPQESTQYFTPDFDDEDSDAPRSAEGRRSQADVGTQYFTPDFDDEDASEGGEAAETADEAHRRAQAHVSTQYFSPVLDDDPDAQDLPEVEVPGSFEPQSQSAGHHDGPEIAADDEFDQGVAAEHGPDDRFEGDEEFELDRSGADTREDMAPADTAEAPAASAAPRGPGVEQDRPQGPGMPERPQAPGQGPSAFAPPEFAKPGTPPVPTPSFVRRPPNERSPRADQAFEEPALERLHGKLEELGIPETDYRIGGPTKLGWSLEQVPEGWRVGWYDDSLADSSVFGDAADAAAFMLGKMLLEPNGRVAAEQGGTEQAEDAGEPRAGQVSATKPAVPQAEPRPAPPAGAPPRPAAGPPQAGAPVPPPQGGAPVPPPAAAGGRPAANVPSPGVPSAPGNWPIQPLPGEPPLTLFRGKKLADLPVGSELDRFGDPDGNLTYVAGTPFPERSLVPEWIDRPYHVYRVQQPIEALTGVAIPWFNQPGGGTAYVLPASIEELLAEGVLIELEPGEPPIA